MTQFSGPMPLVLSPNDLWCHEDTFIAGYICITESVKPATSQQLLTMLTIYGSLLLKPAVADHADYHGPLLFDMYGPIVVSARSQLDQCNVGN